jgi:hypothetical protein
VALRLIRSVVPAAGGLNSTWAKVLGVALLGVAPHNRFHRGVGFQPGGVDPDRLASQQSRSRYLPQHPAKHFLMRGLVHQPAGARDGHMIRRPLIQPDLQKLPQTQRIRHPPRDASFALKRSVKRERVVLSSFRPSELSQPSEVRFS